MMNNCDPPGAASTPERLGRLFDDYAAALELYARQWCRCADDAVQEAFIELAAQRSPPDDPVAWLYRVVRNKAIDALRSAARRKRHECDARPDWFVAAADDRLDAAAAAAALESLPIELREVVVTRIWGGLSFQQIGQLVGVSDSTAHRRYESGLSDLRERLRVPCPNSENR
jgi:RNA polymerase sigma factor (sigma-70 family)